MAAPAAVVVASSSDTPCFRGRRVAVVAGACLSLVSVVQHSRGMSRVHLSLFLVRAH
jgi:hypothetical protein